MPREGSEEDEFGTRRDSRYTRERREDEFGRRKRSRSPRRDVDMFGRDPRERERFYDKDRERDRYYDRGDRKPFYNQSRGQFDGYSNPNYNYPSNYNAPYSQQSYSQPQYQQQYSQPYGGQYQDQYQFQPNYYQGRPNPLQGDQFLLFKQFKDLHDPLPANEISQKYEDYKLEFKGRQMAKFYNQHKTEEWFVEKYHPSFKEQRDLELIKLSKEKQALFAEELSQGKFDNIELEEASDTTSSIEVEQNFQEDEDENKDSEKDTRVSEAESRVLLIKSIPPSIKKTQVLEMCQKVAGFLRLEMGDPNPAKRFHRLAWVTFSESTNIQEVCKILDNTKIDSFQLHFVIYRQKPSRKVSVPAITVTERRLRKDLSQSIKLVAVLDQEKGLTPIFQVSDPDTMALVDVKKFLDKLIMYMRRVHFFDYYMGIQFETEDSLLRRFPSPPLRNNKPGVTTNDEPWEKYLDSKIEARIASQLTPDHEAKLGKKDINNNSEIDTFMDANTLRIDEGKFRCKLCEKLFKGSEFVKKHIVTKHQDNLAAIKEEVTLFNNFVTDYHTIYPLVQQSSMLSETPALPEKIILTPKSRLNEVRGTPGNTRFEIYKDPRQYRSYGDVEDPKEKDEFLEYRLEGVEQ